jgi:hypothetical protein
MSLYEAKSLELPGQKCPSSGVTGFPVGFLEFSARAESTELNSQSVGVTVKVINRD